MYAKKIIRVLLLCVSLKSLWAQPSAAVYWADSVLKTLSQKEKLAQLLLLEPATGAHPDSTFYEYGLGGRINHTGSEDSLFQIPLWQVTGLDLLSEEQRKAPCREERLLFSTTDTLFLQDMGKARAAEYLQKGVSALYTGKQSCVRSSHEQWALAQYIKGLQSGGLFCVSEPVSSPDSLDIHVAVPLVRSDNYKASLQALRSQLGQRFGRSELQAAAKRILIQKYQYLISPKAVPLAPPAALQQHMRLQQALTLLRNEENRVPLQGLDTLDMATVAITQDILSPFFFRRLWDYLEMPQYLYTPRHAGAHIGALASYSHIIASLHAGQAGPKAFSVQQLAFVDSLMQQSNVIWVYFGAAEGLQNFSQLAHSKTLLLAHENSILAQDLATQALFGGVALRGRLSVPTKLFAMGAGLPTQANASLSFVPPEALDVHAQQLRTRIEDIIWEGLQAEAFPGAQLLLAKDGRVFFYESYGYHTYAQKRPVLRESLYDLASLTKAMGASTALMRLHEENKFSVEARLSDYLPKWRNSKKGQLDFRSMLAHHSGLHSWIPYYRETLKKSGKPKRRFLTHTSSHRYSTFLSENLYLHKNFKKLIDKKIEASEIGERGYQYSGLLFYLLPEMIESLSGYPYAKYLKMHFYAPLGASTLTFRPLEHFARWRIVPTEQDYFFRKQLLHGVVHDEGAAMMGGISGNAGLFAKAVDVAKLWQMYLQGGYYGGRRYLSSQVLKTFTACQFCEEENRRGLGFDRPPIVYEEGESSVAPQASQNSFGHTGFTGTIAWADAKHGLLFVFLCNRVYPTRENQEIYVRNIRPRLHQAVYEALCIPVEEDK